jgi:hypothetical protein
VAAFTATAAAQAEVLFQRLIEAEDDDSIDIIALIDEATPEVRALAAALGRGRINESEVG